VHCKNLRKAFKFALAVYEFTIEGLAPGKNPKSESPGGLSS
jgi:hypothetical protein